MCPETESDTDGPELIHCKYRIRKIVGCYELVIRKYLKLIIDFEHYLSTYYCFIQHLQFLGKLFISEDGGNRGGGGGVLDWGHTGAATDPPVHEIGGRASREGFVLV